MSEYDSFCYNCSLKNWFISWSLCLWSSSIEGAFLFPLFQVLLKESIFIWLFRLFLTKSFYPLGPNLAYPWVFTWVFLITICGIIVSFSWTHYIWNRIIAPILIWLSSPIFYYDELNIVLFVRECWSLSFHDSSLWWPYSLVDEASIELLDSEIINSWDRKSVV